MHILVLGATGGTGREIVRVAQAKGHRVTALVRSAARAADLVGAHLVEGDARDASVLARVLQGCEGVISSLGTGLSPFREVTLLSTATHALIAAMRQQNVRRLVCITGVGAGDSRGHGGIFYDWLFQPMLLRNVYADKDRQEQEIRSSGLDWVIVRPTMLNNKPATAQVRAMTDLTGVHGGAIARADVAEFVVAQLGEDAWVGQTPLITW